MVSTPMRLARTTVPGTVGWGEAPMVLAYINVQKVLTFLQEV